LQQKTGDEADDALRFHLGTAKCAISLIEGKDYLNQTMANALKTLAS